MQLFWPLKGVGWIPGIYITQKFGEKLIDYSQYGFIAHNGLDIAAPLGYPVHAITDGWVVEATAKNTGYGLRVSQYFEADGFQWIATYGHFQKINYPDIQWTTWDFDRRINPVRAGQIIGFVNSTGRSTGNHLHLTIQKFKNNILLDPNNGYGGAIDFLPYLKGEPNMSNVLLVQKGKEYGFYLPAINDQAMIDKALNFNYPLPTKNEGKEVDWSKIIPDITI